MRVLEWSQKISHCKSMQIFYNTQGQLTQQSEEVKLIQVLWLPLLHERMKKIESKMKALEWSQHYTSLFKMIKGS